MADTTVEVEDKGKALSTSTGKVRLWLDAIKAASDEEQTWRGKAQDAVNIYRAEPEEAQNTSFNILHSNVETIIPAIYNSTPSPDIRRRFNDPGQASKDVADLLERALSYSLDAYDFDGHMRSLLWDSYVAGRGVSRVRYIPYLQPGSDPSQAGEGEPAETPEIEGGEPAEPGEVVAYEEVRCEYVPWRHFRRGPGFTWEDVSWIAFEHFLTREQLRQLAPKLAEKVSLDCSVEKVGDKKEDGVPQSEIMQRARVWEIWDRETRKVTFLAPSYPDDVLREEDDPLELDGFYCIPRPIVPLYTPGKQVPMCPYQAYEELAKELNEITARIKKITAQLRVRGIYATSATDLEAILKADDGQLVAAQGLEMFAQGGLDKAIAWWPIEPSVKALAQLYNQREQVKQTIYEVTGISDIVRGASAASETATAQQIKQQWGSLRIQRMQADVARYARDLFRMKAEIIAKRFSPQTIMLMTGVQLQPESEQLLRSDVLRGYKIDIESDSTIRADLTRNQENMTNFVMGTANYIAAVAPAIESGIIPSELAVEIYTAFSRNFKLGKQVEDALDRAAQNARDQAQQPQQEKPDPKMIEAQNNAQMAQQQMQADAQLEAQKLQLEQQKAQADFSLKQQQANAELTIKQQQMEADLAMKREQHAMTLQAQMEKHHNDMAMSKEKFSNDAKLSRNKMILDYKVAKTKGTDAGAPVDMEGDMQDAEVSDPMAEAMKPLADAVAQMAETLAAQQAQTMQMLAQVLTVVAAPKKLIRGRGGQVEGVAPDLGMMQ